MSRNGLADPYGYLRTGMMIGTCVSVSNGVVGIKSMFTRKIPTTVNTKKMNMITCSIALMKLTRAVYQLGINKGKRYRQFQ